ncbi:MAG: M23 family metallopeptidase [Myxococcota bacterium]
MRAAPLLLISMLAASGCLTSPHPKPAPERAQTPAPRSMLMGEADEIVAAFASGDVDRIAARMTPRLHERLTVADLQLSGSWLRETYGEPLGILEERIAREGDLQWYSGLVVHSKSRGRRGATLTPVLYQFALTRTRQLERLLVREHWFIEHVEPPAENFVPVTRFHVPAHGEWTVSQGGPTRELNAHHGSVSQRFAYDLVLVIDGRFRKRDAPAKSNEAYFGYGQPLLAPAAGEVIRVVEGVPDNVPKTMGRAGGNGVVIDHGFGEFSSLWHAKTGSVQVKVGDHVEPGQVIGQVGNSGRSSGAHIHFHVTRNDGDFGLPAPLVDLRVDGAPKDLALPVKGAKIESRATLGDVAEAATPRVFVDA